MSDLYAITKELSNHLDELKLKFEQNEKPATNKEFFLQMKKETNPIFNLLEYWEKTAFHFVQNESSLLGKEQIAATKENMESLILHSYYIDVRKRRYFDMYRSCHYIFNQLLRELT